MSDKPDATPAGGVSTEPLTAPEQAGIQAFVPQVVEVKLQDRPAPAEDGPDPRESIEDAAAKRVMQRREKEARAPVEAPPEAQPPAAVTVPEQNNAPAQGAPPAPQPAAQPAADAPRMVRIKVDGVETDVPETELVKNYQIEATARQRMEHASRAEREAKDRLAEADRILLAARAQQPPREQEPPPPPKPSRADLIAKVAEAQLSGTKEEITQALNDLVDGLQAPEPARNLRQEVVETIRAEQDQQRSQEAIRRLYAENKEIVEDEIMSAGVAAITHREMVSDLIKLGVEPQRAQQLSAEDVGSYHAQFRRMDRARPFDEITRQSVEAVKTKFGLGSTAAPTQAPASASPLAIRLDAKRETASPPAPATARPQQKIPQRKSHSDVIAEDRAARGHR